jgi:heme exporter protein D
MPAAYVVTIVVLAVLVFGVCIAKPQLLKQKRYRHAAQKLALVQSRNSISIPCRSLIDDHETATLSEALAKLIFVFMEPAQ